MHNNNQPTIDYLISYYKELIEINNKFADLQFSGNNYRYEDLIKRLVSIRQLMIDKNLATVNTVYKPTENLFDCKEHFTILETVIKYYRQNKDLDYPMPATQFDTDIGNNINEQIADTISQALSTVDDMIKKQISDVQEQVKRLVNDSLAALTTSHELLKSDIKKYDALLTEHITKSGINTVEAIEKEHLRFVQNIASDSKSIIAEITKANIAELATQTELIQTSMQELDDKSFKRSCYVFMGVICALLGCSLLSSVWAANKALGNAKIFRVEAICKPNLPVTPQKMKHY